MIIRHTHPQVGTVATNTLLYTADLLQLNTNTPARAREAVDPRLAGVSTPLNTGMGEGVTVALRL